MLKVGFFSLVLVASYFFLNSVLDNLYKNLLEENDMLESKLRTYVKKYDDLVEFNKKNGASSQDGKLIDYKNENDKEIQEVKNHINELTDKMQKISNEIENNAKSISEKQRDKLKKELTSKQEQANKNYLEDIKKKKNEHLTAKKNAFKYYYNYTKEERDRIKTLVNHVQFNITQSVDQIEDLRQTLKKHKSFDNYESFQPAIKEISNKVNKFKQEFEQIKIEHSSQIEELSKTKFLSDECIDLAAHVLHKMKTSKNDINNHLGMILGHSFEFKDYYNKLYETFGFKNFNFKLLFNSKRFDEYEESKEYFVNNVVNKSNLLIFAQNDEDKLIGGYISVPFPNINTTKADQYELLEDPNSFIFTFKAKDNSYEILKALPYAKNHFFLENHNSTIIFGFGNYRHPSGFHLKINNLTERDKEQGYEIFSYNMDKVSIDFEDPYLKDSMFNTTKKISNKVKLIKIYQISFLE